MNKYVFGFPELNLLICIPASDFDQAKALLKLTVANSNDWNYVGVDGNIDAGIIVELSYKEKLFKQYECSCNSYHFHPTSDGYKCVVCGKTVKKTTEEGELVEN